MAKIKLEKEMLLKEQIDFIQTAFNEGKKIIMTL